MKNQSTLISFWTKVSFKVILLFFAAMLMSFVPDIEVVSNFFGDYEHVSAKFGCSHGLALHYASEGEVHVHWGWRHYLFNIMCIILFVIQAIRIIAFISEESDI